MIVLKQLSRALDKSFTNASRSRARRDLLGRSDRFLSDNGFSRKLLESGAHAWPWRDEEGESSTTSSLVLPHSAQLAPTGASDRPNLVQRVAIVKGPSANASQSLDARIPVGTSSTDTLSDSREERIAA